jgi:hypothetical protein
MNLSKQKLGCLRSLPVPEHVYLRDGNMMRTYAALVKMGLAEWSGPCAGLRTLRRTPAGDREIEK